MKHKLLGYAAAAGLTAAAGLGAVTGGIYLYAFYSPRGKQNDDHHISVPMNEPGLYERSIRMIDRMNERPYERVSVTSFDGLRLSGRYYRMRDGAPLAILCHGYRGTPSRDFCGGAEICFSLGYNVLLIEERAHCTSEGHTTTFGVKERYDALTWTRYAVQRFGSDVKILLGGISMGGGTVLMSSALDLPENVRGILADCPFTSPAEIIRSFGEKSGLPMKIAFPMAALSARLWGGFSLTAADAAEAVKSAKVPILLIHGEADGLVPCDMSRVIAEANPALTERHTFPGAEHGLSYMADTDRYRRIVADFCARIFADR